MRRFDIDKDLLKYYNSNSLKIPKNIEVLNSFLDEVELNLDIKIGNLLGLGFEGQVYEILDSDKCIKFQTRTCNDYSDIKTQLYLEKNTLKNIANIYEVGVIHLNKFREICLNGEFNEIYYIISDKLIINESIKQLFSNLDKDYSSFKKEINLSDILNYDNQGDNLLGFLEDTNDYDLTNELLIFFKHTKFTKEVNQLIDILNELKQHEIFYNDFVTKNLGFNNESKLCIFDLNGYEGDNEDLEIKKVLNI